MGRTVKLFATVLLAGCATIISISRPLASPEAPQCTQPPRVMGNVLPPAAPGKDFALPEQMLTGPDGAPVALKSLLEGARGTVLNLWATWCAPCIREMPALDRLHALLAGEGIRVLALSEDRTEPAVPAEFLKINKIENLGVLIDPKGQLARSLGVRGLPTTLLIDSEGRERARVEGIAEWDDPEALAFIRRCLAPADGG